MQVKNALYDKYSKDFAPPLKKCESQENTYLIERM